MPRHLSCGLDFSCVPDIKASLSIASENGFVFACVPITHPRLKREFLEPDAVAKQGAFTRSDLILGSEDWSNMIVGKISSQWDCDCDDELVRKASEAGVVQELMFGCHLNLPAIILSLHGSKHVNLARLICDFTFQHHNTNPIWIHVPMVSPQLECLQYRENCDKEVVEDASTWKWWNSFRLLCNMDRKLGVLLELSADLPDLGEIDRWFGEPVKAVLVPTRLFLTNKKGFPVLSAAHQMVLKRAYQLELQVVVTGINRHSMLKHYVQYVDYLYQNKTMDVDDGGMPFSKGYEDHLQIPLQPLMDNLESSTYEVFEKDPVKYTEYQKAVYHVLLDRVPQEQADTSVQIVMVVGAGRGPLVTSAFMAAESAGRQIRVYAVEKNPNACVTLFSLKEEVWKDKVIVVSGDMRDWTPPEMCDILISELLGSFGDNELSPECLDGPERFLKPDGISIPSSYRSYLSPLMSSRLYNEARQCINADKKYYTRFEMPYVVHQVNAYNLAPPQLAFSFSHPKTVVEHKRYTILTFEITEDSELHGFSGYFDATLYQDIKISIHPESHSKGMFSWFPIYFPIKEPVHLKKGDKVVAHFWRLSDKRYVWYEWTISQPVQIPIHNPNGRSYNIGLH